MSKKNKQPRKSKTGKPSLPNNNRDTFLHDKKSQSNKKDKIAHSEKENPSEKKTVSNSPTNTILPSSRGLTNARLVTIWFIVMVANAAIQWSDGNYSTRNLIDYDDLQVIKPLFDLSWSEYWSDWFFERTNYAFPLRDITFVLDRALVPYLTEGIYWVSQFAFHAAAMFFVFAAFRNILGSQLLIPSVLFAVVVFHNMNIETLQWQTCRKYVVPGVPLAIGTFLVSKHLGTVISNGTRIKLIALWFAALSAYPTASFWIFWAFATLWYFEPKRNTGSLLKWSLGCLVALVSYLAFVGSGTGEVSAGLSSVIMNVHKSTTLGQFALGRGFFNFLAPFFPAPYYSELSPFTTYGFWAFTACLLALGFIILKNKAFRSSKDFEFAAVFLSLGGVFFIPTVNTILSFHDFMLADRHFYLSIPWFVLGTFFLGRALLTHSGLKFLKRYPKTGLMLTAVWITCSILTSIDYVPRWRHSFDLMTECVKTERSPRCHSQSVRRVFFKDKCTRAAEVFDSAYTLYKDLPTYSLEFRTEIPFFHAGCIALSASMTPDQKIKAIDSMVDAYKESPDLMFGLVLAYLEKGETMEAFNIASGYYLSTLDKGAIFATNSLLAVYEGHIQAMCNIDTTGQCLQRLTRYRILHPKGQDHKGSIDWGLKATELMIKRGAPR